jgi:hypothetical protein
MEREPLNDIEGTPIYDDEAHRERVAQSFRKHKTRPRCPDCGKYGERMGHQDCEYPGISGGMDA